MVLKTLQIEHAYLLLVYTLLTLVNSRLQKGMRGVKLFVLYNALALAGAVAVLMRGSIPDFVSIVVGNVCVLACYTALYGSMHRLFGFSRKQHILAAVWLSLGIPGMLWLGFLHPLTAPRLVVYSFVLALQQFHLGVLLLSRSGEGRRLAWMPSTFLILLGSANIVRIVAVSSHGAPTDYRAAGSALAAIVLANACLQCGLMVSYVWMTAARLRHDLEVQATTDPLTGLLNRRALEAAALRLIRTASEAVTFSAILIDLDGFKPINDRLGHATGDQALSAVARILQRRLRGRDIVARTGGDEFMALLPATTAADAMLLAGELRRALEELRLAPHEARLTGSFGVVEATPGESWDNLCARCDQALYAAKGEGGNAVQLCTVRNPAVIPELFLAIP